VAHKLRTYVVQKLVLSLSLSLSFSFSLFAGLASDKSGLGRRLVGMRQCHRIAYTHFEVASLYIVIRASSVCLETLKSSNPGPGRSRSWRCGAGRRCNLHAATATSYGGGGGGCGKLADIWEAAAYSFAVQQAATC
jgi:hypothetical protein